MRLTYWACECLTDGKCYNIRERTKKAAKARMEAENSKGGWKFGKVTKIEIEYRDGFDLMLQCCQEGGPPECFYERSMKGKPLIDVLDD